MGVIRIDPFRGFDSLSRKMNQVMNDFEKGFTVESGGFNPRIDMQDEEESIIVYVELPGMKKEDVNISISEDRLLTLKGVKIRIEDDDKDMNFIRRERVFGEFTRTFALPDDTNIDEVSANFKNGILKIEIGKLEPRKPKEINIEIK